MPGLSDTASPSPLFPVLASTPHPAQAREYAVAAASSDSRGSAEAALQVVMSSNTASASFTAPRSRRQLKTRPTDLPEHERSYVRIFLDLRRHVEDGAAGLFIRAQ